MRFGLVLGGGGVVGIAWEIGVLAGLERAGVFDPAAVDAFVGTSAGSVVGSRLALGHAIESLVEEQGRPAPAAAASTGDAAPRADMRVVMEIFGELRKAEAVTPEVTRVVGQKAMAATTPSEAKWVESFETTLGGADWPAGRDLRVVALDCHSGERRVWTAADAAIAPLPRAVASSCAVPGMFPTVGIGESRYTDGGVWSGSNADVLVGDGFDAVVFIGPMGAQPVEPGRRAAVDVEADRLVASGARFLKVGPGERFATEIGLMNLMNPAQRQLGVEIGIADGTAAAAEVAQLLA